MEVARGWDLDWETRAELDLITEDFVTRGKKDQDARNRSTRLSALCPPHAVTMIGTRKKHPISPFVIITKKAPRLPAAPGSAP